VVVVVVVVIARTQTVNARCRNITNITTTITNLPRVRRDLGEWLFAPIARLLPRSLRPNHITAANHLCNWSLLWLSAVCLDWPTASQRATGLFGCALLTLLVNALDVLD